jgi:hypothetical protein
MFSRGAFKRRRRRLQANGQALLYEKIVAQAARVDRILKRTPSACYK